MAIPGLAGNLDRCPQELSRFGVLLSQRLISKYPAFLFPKLMKKHLKPEWPNISNSSSSKHALLDRLKTVSRCPIVRVEL